LTLINTKVEYAYYASILNPYNTSHFAWIDFGIFHVFKNIDKMLFQLQKIAFSNINPNILLIPGPLPTNNSIEQLINNVYWRFCGGFFLGDKRSIINFYNTYINNMSDFLNKYSTLVWEVNFWSWLENNCNFPITWYYGDHNDTIIDIPNKYIIRPTVVASLTTIPPRINSCYLTLNSLIHQVDMIYLNVSYHYKRFGSLVLPEYLNKEPYLSKVKITYTEDKGPATKYLGALSEISEDTWIFFCDDDQEYHNNLINNMVNRIIYKGVYQNRYYHIRNDTSGGIIHGFVGNLIHRSLLNNLLTFPMPEISKFVDDQWMSIYCFFEKIPIFPSGIEQYSDIYKVLENNHEKIGVNSLYSLGNRDKAIKDLADYFNVHFNTDGTIEIIEKSTLQLNQ
jgi:hypothetical protein